jgi:hypothetical protein
MSTALVRKPFLLVSIGLLGLSFFRLALRFHHPAWMENDVLQGLVLGLCLALELGGVLLLRKAKCRRSAGSISFRSEDD